jgi:hypothetical protein
VGVHWAGQTRVAKGGLDSSECALLRAPSRFIIDLAKQ